MNSEKIWNFKFFEFSQTTLVWEQPNFQEPPPPHLPDVLCRRPLIYYNPRIIALEIEPKRRPS